MKDKGIKTLDSIIVTHFDNDHSGGAAALMKNVNVKNIYVNDLNHESFEAQKIYQAAKDYGVEIILAENLQKVYENSDLCLTNLVSTIGKNDNDNSILTLLSYYNFKMLFTGDAGIEGLEASLNNIPENITVLKVPHHGASEVLSQHLASYLHPKYSLISVGENKFGHPDIYTLELLKDSIILRTDIHNSIRFVVNKSETKVLGYNMKKKKYQRMY